MRFCSYGRSLLVPVSGSVSLRRLVRGFLAARRRFPAGRLALRFGGLVWLLPDGCAAVSWSLPRFPRAVRFVVGFPGRVVGWARDPFFPRSGLRDWIGGVWHAAHWSSVD